MTRYPTIDKITCVACAVIFAGCLLGGASHSRFRSANRSPKPILIVEQGVEDPNEPYLIDQSLLELGYYREDVPLSFELQDAVHTSCERYGIEYAVALGLIQTESGFDTQAVNPASGCYGLAQLNPAYFPSGLSPADNIDAGLAYLQAQVDRYGSLEAGLQAYHDGHDTGERWYAQAVLNAAEGWRA